MAESKIVPLSGSFMIAGIVGFAISALYIYPRSNTWGFALAFLFVIVFIASMISMTYAPVNPKY